MTKKSAAKRLALPKTRRLTSPADFEQIKKTGRVERGRFLMLSCLVKTDAAFRAGFITSRAIGRAVVRNRIRRRLREIVRKHQHEIVSGVWLVTIARVHAVAASYRDLEGEWLRLAGRASILAA
jgi:ribonuclease P protein component